MKCILVNIQIYGNNLKANIDSKLLKAAISTRTQNVYIHNTSNINTWIIPYSNITKAHFNFTTIQPICANIASDIKAKFSIKDNLRTNIKYSSRFKLSITKQKLFNINIVHSKCFNTTITKACILNSIIVKVPSVFINYLGDDVLVEVISTTTWDIK